MKLGRVTTDCTSVFIMLLILVQKRNLQWNLLPCVSEYSVCNRQRAAATLEQYEEQ